MTHEQREQFVRDLLTMSGVEEQSVERSVYCALHDALMAAVYFELLGGEEKDFVSKMLKKAQFFFSSKMSLKEKKQSKKKKSTFPPDPQSDKKEKTKKEKKHTYTVADAGEDAGSKKGDSLDERREAFRREVLAFRGVLSDEALTTFYAYWAEESPRSKKMRFEQQRSWNLELRLKRWSLCQYTQHDEEASDRKQRQSKKQAQKEAQDTAKVEADRLAAQMREEQDRQREEQLKQAKAGKMTPEEFAQLHPDSLMAKMMRK